jgi:hypothetical protein
VYGWDRLAAAFRSGRNSVTGIRATEFKLFPSQAESAASGDLGRGSENGYSIEVLDEYIEVAIMRFKITDMIYVQWMHA